jgi:hypothetical protein
MREMPPPGDRTEGSERSWTLLTSHGRVLLLIAQDPQLRIRELADAAGVTERSAQAIVADLERAGYLSKSKVGRRNAYTIHAAQPFRHPAESGHTVGELMQIFAPAS